jgi:hypothetical protein
VGDDLRTLARASRARQAEGKQLGRSWVPPAMEDAVRAARSAGIGILKMAKTLGLGTKTVQRIRRRWRRRPDPCVGRALWRTQGGTINLIIRAFGGSL